MDEGKVKAQRRQPSPISRAAPEQDRALPGEGEPKGSAVALGGDARVLGMQMRGRTGKRGARGYLTGGMVSVAGGDGRGGTGLALAGMGSGIAVQCPGVRGTWSLGGTRVSNGTETDALVVQSYQHAGVRPRGQRCNGREREGICAGGALG
jgi:hypothetical protein